MRYIEYLQLMTAVGDVRMCAHVERNQCAAFCLIDLLLNWFRPHVIKGVKN